MPGLTETDKQQLLAAGAAFVTPNAALGRPPAPPILSMPDYLRQVEQLAWLLPPAPRLVIQGDNWKL